VDGLGQHLFNQRPQVGVDELVLEEKKESREKPKTRKDA
jgi:hypothetical protein